MWDSRVLGDGTTQNFGDIIEVPESEGAKLVASGLASPVDEPQEQPKPANTGKQPVPRR